MKKIRIFSDNWSEEIAAYCGIALHIALFVGLGAYSLGYITLEVLK